MRTQTRTAILGGLLLASVAAFGCGGGAQVNVNTGGSDKGTGPSAPTAEMTGDAKAKYEAALAAFNGHDKANDWNEATCNDTAKLFDAAAAAQTGGKLPPATYNAGKALQRCGLDGPAKAKFEQIYKDDPKNHFARAELALYKYKADSNEDAAIQELQQVVLDAQFQNVPALVDLAAIQMLRDSANASSNDCKDDFDCAKRNLQRALAIDDAYMPAFNQLALFYFQVAKKRAGSVRLSAKGARGRSIATHAAMGKRADVQQLELAALVVSQGIRKNAGYAPIYNTAGLIQNELGQINGAVQSFKTAAKLDPKFFEAQMNYAFVNLSFRGFEEAQGAFKRALEMRPNDYDGHLGLALAMRGLINDSNYDQQVAAVQAELDQCKKLAPDRPDTYYNEGILTMEYKAKAGGDKSKTIAALEASKGIFQQFIEKASGKAEYDGAVKRSKERIQDATDTIQFLQIGDQGPKDEPKADEKKDEKKPEEKK
jgi:tetratricopeptide (TPR) repeat protein